MNVVEIGGVRIEGVYACVPHRAVPNEPDLAKVTGIRTRRVAAPGVSPLDLSLKAAERLLPALGREPDDFGALVDVSFTRPRRMPAGATEAQARLGLPKDLLALDVQMACSGYGYGLFLAASLARQTGRRTLLLDGDVQSAFLDPADRTTTPVMADGGTATVIAPEGDDVWSFAFLSDGAQGGALRLDRGDSIRMDGFGVFRFVATDVVRFLRDFQSAAAFEPTALDAFVPHQANVYMITQLAKSLGVPPEKLVVACDDLGNLSSASVPSAIALRQVRGRTLIAGFGGGLSASAALVTLPETCRTLCFDDAE